MFKNVCWSSFKVPVTFVISEINFILWMVFRSITQKLISWISVLWETNCCQTQTDEQRNMMNLNVAYRSFENALAINEYPYCRKVELAFLAFFAETLI